MFFLLRLRLVPRRHTAGSDGLLLLRCAAFPLLHALVLSSSVPGCLVDTDRVQPAGELMSSRTTGTSHHLTPSDAVVACDAER